MQRPYGNRMGSLQVRVVEAVLVIVNGQKSIKQLEQKCRELLDRQSQRSRYIQPNRHYRTTVAAARRFAGARFPSL